MRYRRIFGWLAAKSPPREAPTAALSPPREAPAPSPPTVTREEYLRTWVTNVNRKVTVADLPAPTLAAHYVEKHEALAASQKRVLDGGYVLWNTQAPTVGTWIETVRLDELYNSSVWCVDGWTPSLTAGLWWRQTSEPAEKEQPAPVG